MAGINKVILVGRLGYDPEIRIMPAGSAMATLSVATSESYIDRNGQKQERTEWHRVIFWEKRAEVCRDYLKKGSLVYIEGKITTRKWQDQQGIDRYSTEIQGQQLQMLGSKQDNQTQAPAQYTQQPQQQSQPQNTDNFDDDIPF